MAFVPMTAGGGGSASLVETVLWTNASPNSNFAAQSVALSDDINNYDFIKLTYKFTTNAASETMNLWSSVTDYKSTVWNSAKMLMMYGKNSGTGYVRYWAYDDDTHTRFSTAYAVAATGSSAAVSIPLTISGVKMECS